MFNKEVIERITFLYSIFDIKLLTFIAAGFTIYFGYQKITKRICVSYSFTNSTLFDTHLTNFVISNKRDNVIIVSSIYMKIGEKGSIKIIEFPEPLVLKGYDAKLIDIPQYSSIYGANGPISIEYNDRLSFSVVTRSGDEVFCEVESPVTAKDLEGGLLKNTIKFNNIILTRNMGFIFTYSINGTVKNVVFDKHGFIEGYTPFSYNMFKDISEETFGEFLVSNGYHNIYDDYSLYKILDNLGTALVLSKASMQKKLS